MPELVSQRICTSYARHKHEITHAQMIPQFPLGVICEVETGKKKQGEKLSWIIYHRKSKPKTSRVAWRQWCFVGSCSLINEQDGRRGYDWSRIM